MFGLARLRFLFLKVLSILFAAAFFVVEGTPPRAATANDVTAEDIVLVNQEFVGVSHSREPG